MYDFRIKIGEIETQVYPRYNDRLNLEFSTTPHLGRRKRLSGAVRFVNQDYDLIMAATPFEKIRFSIKDTFPGFLFQGWFQKKDGKIDEDNKIFEVEIRTDDNYEEILDVLNTEVDLFQINARRIIADVDIPALYQFYCFGSSSIDNLHGGTNWRSSGNVYEQPIIYDSTRIRESDFGGVQSPVEAVILQRYSQSVSITRGLNTTWIADFDIGTFANNYISAGKSLLIQYETIDDGRWFVKTNDALGTKLWRSNAVGQIGIRRISHPEVVFTKTDGSGETFQFEPERHIRIKELYNRHQNFYSAIKSLNRKSDLVRYRTERLEGGSSFPSLQFDFVTSTQTQVSPTEWGIASNGRYFVKPTVTGNRDLIPIGIDTWDTYSIWVSMASKTGFDPITKNATSSGKVQQDVRCYQVMNVVEDICKHFGIGVACESEFFTNPTNPIRNNVPLIPIITHVNNINSTGSFEPIKSIRLSDIFNYLQRFNIFWGVYDNKIRLEHISWFMNGEVTQSLQTW